MQYQSELDMSSLDPARQPGCTASSTPELQLTTSSAKQLQWHLPTWRVCCLAFVPSRPRTKPAQNHVAQALSITSANILHQRTRPYLVQQTTITECNYELVMVKSPIGMLEAATTDRNRYGRQLKRGAWMLQPTGFSGPSCAVAGATWQVLRSRGQVLRCSLESYWIPSLCQLEQRGKVCRQEGGTVCLQGARRSPTKSLHSKQRCLCAPPFLRQEQMNQHGED